jgi:hypothetical protein
MDNFEVPSRYQQAKDQESASADGYSRPDHSQCIMNVSHMTASFCVVLCRHTETNMLTKQNVCISVKQMHGGYFKA